MLVTSNLVSTKIKQCVIVVNLLRDTFLSGINTTETVHDVGSCLFLSNELFINQSEKSRVVDW